MSTMKPLCKIAGSISLFFALLVQSMLAQSAPANPANLVIGVGGPLSTSANWSNYSAINVIPGSSILPITSTTTALYLGFTGGTFADVNNMVLYTTKRQRSGITAVTPVKLGGVSDPTINLTSRTTCPNGAVSATNPCIVRLDTLTLTLSPANDYYFVVYFTSNTNNASLIGAISVSAKTSLTGAYFNGDYSRLRVGQAAPLVGTLSGCCEPYFLMYVMTN